MAPAFWVLLAVFFSSLPIFGRLWFDNRHTSLAHATLWAALAWFAWILTLPLDPIGNNAGPYIYLALALTGCAGIAVLGARRPGVNMWNAVVLALLLVELLPWGEALVGQKDFHVDGLRLATLAGALFVGVANYLPTRAFAGALLVGLGCACQWLRLWKSDEGSHQEIDILGRCALAAAPWLILLVRSTWPTRSANEFDRTWLSFRERYGVVWGQRLREQFNQSARHSNWDVILTWQGLRMKPGASQPGLSQSSEMRVTLNALMKRFGRKDEVSTTASGLN